MDQKTKRKSNKLINESSPYLLQHAHNPVEWYPWGEEALEKAKSENKLLIISIGYAACHWCHVMEHESFEDDDVARYMNQNFVAIKVDREERPDIDQIYMSAVQIISGRGGWPLNCVALPDGRPLYGGTYYRKDQWLDMLRQISEFVKNDPLRTEEQANAMTYRIRAAEMVYLNKEQAEFTVRDLDFIFENWKQNIDYNNGGSVGAPKFPLPIGYNFLLHYYNLTENDDARRAVTVTLSKMAHGGIYDQIGGGFARYSTDTVWRVPHFEKMLYDNAQLVTLYSAAHQLSGDSLYEKIVTETLEFVKNELTSDEGGFYSSLDADSEGAEGTFYLWDLDEIKKLLGDKADLIIDYYNVTEKGNWESSGNILYRSDNVDFLLSKYSIDLAELNKRVAEANMQLLTARNKRVRPALDDKIITSWNGLMIKAYADAYCALHRDEYLEAALRGARFIQEKTKSSEGQLHRCYKEGKTTINAFLDDYAFTIAAFIALYQSAFDEQWLDEAKNMADYTITHFFDENHGMFLYTSDIDPALIARKMEVTDNVIPSSNSEMARNLFLLGTFYADDSYVELARRMLNNVKESTVNGGPYYANWDILLSWFADPPYVVAILGDDYTKLRLDFGKYYLPNMLYSGGKTEGLLSLHKGKLKRGVTTINICRGRVCNQPVTNVKDALTQIKS